MQRWIVAWLVASGCGGDPAPDAPVEPAPRCDPQLPFGAPELIESLSSDLDDVAARLSPDELEVVFSRKNTSGIYDLWRSARPSIDEPFAAPSLLTSVNSVNNDVWPALSPDGLTLMFDDDRTTPGTYGIWSSKRASLTSTFGPPSPRAELMPGDMHVALPTDHAVYFASGVRPGVGARDIWRADLDDNGAIGVPVAVVGGVNTADDEVTPAVTADERHIFFRRTTGAAPTLEDDIYTASRSTPQDGFGQSSPVAGLSMPGISETPSWVSADSCNLYLFAALPGGPTGQNLYVARRPL